MEVRPVLIVSGPPGAGKTSVSAVVAGRFERGLHLSTDFFFDAIRSGHIAPWLPAAAAQNETVVRAAASAAAPYALAGYATVIDGVVLPWALAIYGEELARRAVEMRCVVLLPEVDEVVRRGMGRAEQHGLDEGVYREMHRQVRDAYPASSVVRQATVISELASVETIADAVVAAWETNGSAGPVR